MPAVSALAIAALVLLTQCGGPVEPPRSDGYSEFESVWQYLKAYSIYQDSSIYAGRIPDNPFSFSSIDAMMKAVGDTLYGDSYTRILSNASSATTQQYAAGTGPDVAAAAVNTVVALDTLTDSTVRISISSFEYGITYNEFVSVLPGVRTFPKVIIDLREDGGGDIEDAQLIVNAFLPAGTPYLWTRKRVYEVSSHTARTEGWVPWKTADVARPELTGKKIAVLMDHGSASASEIVIAALKDCRGATLVGVKSYGKGIGQIKLNRRDRPMLQITFLQMRRYIKNSSGTVVFDSSACEYHRQGITPDVPVTGTYEQQLLAAVRVHEPSAPRLRRLRKQAAVQTPVAGYRIIDAE
jgi:hypothetical protein